MKPSPQLQASSHNNASTNFDRKSLKTLLFGYTMIFCNALLMTISSASVTGLRGKIPHFELMLGRLCFLTVFAGCVLYAKGEKPRLPENTRMQGMLLLAVFINTMVVFLYYSSSYFLPLGQVGALYRAGTMIISVTLARWLLNEEVTASKIVSLLFSISGIMFILIPAILIEEKEQSIDTALSVNRTVDAIPLRGAAIQVDLNRSSILLDYHGNHDDASVQMRHVTTNTGSLGLDVANVSSPLIQPQTVETIHFMPFGYAVVLIAALSNGGDIIMLSGFLHGITTTCIAFWFGALGCYPMFCIMILFEEVTVPDNLSDLGLCFIHGTCSSSAVFSFILATKSLTASNTSTGQSIHIVLMYITQCIVINPWEDQNNQLFNHLELVGILLCIAGVMVMPINATYIHCLYKWYVEYL